MQNITSIIASHISNLYGDISFSPTLSAPPKPEHGEYCFGVFTLAKPLGKSPNIIAEEIATELHKDVSHFTQVNTIGGYVNFSCTAEIWMEILNTISNPEIVKPGKRKTIVVDYIGANTGKPLHIGHLCTPSIGQTICNIYKHLGYQVIGDSHFGDWGGVPGKIIAAGKQEHQNNIQEFQKNIHSKGVNYLLDLYQQATKIIDLEKIEGKIDFDNTARAESKKLSEGNPENVELWKTFTSISITEIEKKLDLLNVHAKYNIGESFYEGIGLPRPNNENYPDLEFTMKDIVAELIKNKVATQNEDGSVGVVFSEESKLPSCILQKKDGTGLYLTSDLAAIKYRLTNGWNPSKIIYSVDVRQQLHLRQAFAIAKMAWPEQLANVELFHAFNGFIKLKEGAMSTRHGTVIFLEKLIEEGEERTEKVLAEKGRSGENYLKKEDIQAITVGAIKYSYLSQDREKDVTFDWDKALSFEGNSGPYIQYACVRARKIIESTSSPSPFSFREGEPEDSLSFMRQVKTGELARLFGSGSKAGLGGGSLSQYDTALIRTLAEMEQKIQTTADTYKPHTLALYCYDLAVCFNSFYVHTPKILEESNTDLKNLRLTLCKLTSERLTLGFDLLGIKMPSEM